MAFSLDEYAKKKQGFSLDAYAEEKVRKQQEERDITLSSFGDWQKGVSDYFTNWDNDYNSRAGSYQDQASLDAYRSSNARTRSEYAAQAAKYADYFNRNRDAYENVDDTLRWLASVKTGLEEQGKSIDALSAYNSRFTDEAGYNKLLDQRKWDTIDKNADFEEKSQYKSKETPIPEEDQVRLYKKNGEWVRSDSDTIYSSDIMYDYINGNQTIKDKANQYKSYAGLKQYDNIPEDIRKKYNYVYETEGKDKALEYLAYARRSALSANTREYAEMDPHTGRTLEQIQHDIDSGYSKERTEGTAFVDDRAAYMDFLKREREAALQDYEQSVMSSNDFAENSDYRFKDKIVTTGPDLFGENEYASNPWGSEYSDTFEKLKYINGFYAYQSGIQPGLDAGSISRNLTNSQMREATDEEKAVANYLANTNNPKELKRYLDSLVPVLNERSTNNLREEIDTLDPITSSALSVVLGPAKGISYAKSALDRISGNRIDPNDPWQLFSNLPTSLRASVTDRIEKGIESDFGKKAASFGYQTAMSMADFLYTTLISGGFGAAAEGAAAQKIAEVLSLSIMSTGAAADALIEAKNEGLDDGRAFAIGTIAGAAEYFTEKVSLETLLNPDYLKNGALKYVLKNILAEGSEEVASDLINTVSDVLIAQDASDWQNDINEYVRQGYSQEEAFGLAVGNKAKEMGLSFAGGAISGGVMAGAGVGFDKLGKYNAGARLLQDDYGTLYSDLIDEGMRYDANTKAGRLARELNNTNTRSRLKTGELISAVEQADFEELVQELQKITQNIPAPAQENVLENAAREKVEAESGIVEPEPEAKPAKTNAKKAFETLSAPDKAMLDSARGLIQNSITRGEANHVMLDTFDALLANQIQMTGTIPSDLDGYLFDYDSFYQSGKDGADITTVANEGALNTKEQEAAYLSGQIEAQIASESASIDNTRKALDNIINSQEGVNYGRRSDALYGSGERVAVQSAGKQGQRVVGETKRTAEAGSERFRAKDSEIRDQKRTGKEITAVDFRIPNGTEATKARLWVDKPTSAMRRASEALKKHGIKTVYFVGDNLSTETAKGALRAVFDPRTNTAYIRVDHPKFDANELARHEILHAIVSNNDESVHSENVDKLWNELKSAIRSENATKLLDLYKQAYPGLTEEDLMEEILADMYAGMNVFSAAAEYEEYVEWVDGVIDDALSYREAVETDIPEIGAKKGTHTKFSTETLPDGSQYVKLDGNLFLRSDGTEMTPREAFRSLVGTTITFDDGETIRIANGIPNVQMYHELFTRYPAAKNVLNMKLLNDEINRNIIEVFQESKAISKDILDRNGEHAASEIVSFDTRRVSIADDSSAYDLDVTIAKLKNGEKIAYTKRFVKANEELTQKITRANIGSTPTVPLSKNRITDKENSVKQEISSAGTSIKQIPALFRDKKVTFGKTNIDIGGGKYDLATNYLAEQGVTNMVFDPYNRDEATNQKVIDFLKSGKKADTATCANVLNVIAEQPARSNVILEVAKAIKADGKAYFMVYEGDGSGKGRETSAGYQNNLKTEAYVSEIEEWFEDVKRQGKLITATNPKKNLPAALWETTPGKAVRFSREIVNELNDEGVDIVDGSAVKFSRETWIATDKGKITKALTKAGYTKDEIQKWIDDVNSIAAMIGADVYRLDYDAADNQVMLKNNDEYIKTLDASTLCAKRLLYQGTFNRIVELLPNTVLTPDDLIEIRRVMAEEGDTVPCGICYVESRRKTLSEYAGRWLNEEYKGKVKVNMNDLTSTDGLEALRKNHPDIYEQYTAWMRARGTANPKIVELRTAYRGDILKLTKGTIDKIKRIGGLRVQSFSDFETVHLIDMMQAVLDMSAKGLTSQAYTKVPNFAWVFGDTGIKINLSLIGKAENGKLVFDPKEGMDINDAMKLRDRYSENVGTILVGANKESILLAMADDRIDFIIPFHRSGWSKSQFEALGLKGYEDFQKYQNERKLNGKSLPKKVGNLYPIDYWDYSKTGKENAERYLEICKEQKRIPKFDNFLVNNGDGSWSLQPDGSTDGYWKLLIDFKMYDNNGVGAPQRLVTPNFNMEEARRVLNEYNGEGNRSLPVDEVAAQKFVKEYKKNHKGVKYSSEIDYSEAQEKYKGKSMTKDKEIYSYDFLTSLPPITTVELPDIDQIYKNGRVDRKGVINAGLKNVANVGEKTNGELAVINNYTAKRIFVYTSTLSHGLNGEGRSLITGSRIATKAGELIKNSLPINALRNKAAGVEGTYATASYAFDKKGREVIAIATIEERNSRLIDYELVDVAHAIRGRIRKGTADGQQTPGLKSSFNAVPSSISVADFLKIVKETHQSILSDDVLAHFGEKKNPEGHYAKEVLFSREPLEYDTAYNNLQDLRRQLIDALRENAIMKKQIEEYEKQFKVSGATFTDASMKKWVRSITKEYGNKINLDIVESSLKNAGEIFFKERKNLEPDVLEGKIREALLPAAGEIVKNASVPVEDGNQANYRSLRQTLKKGIRISDQDKHDIPDYNDWRKANIGYVTISDKGQPMDTLWSELQSEFGKGLFPDEITHPADQLMQAVEVLKDMNAIYENPYQNYDMAEAVDYVDRNLLESLYNGILKQTAPTFADKMEARIEAERQSVMKKVESAVEANQKVNDRLIEHLKKQYKENMKMAVRAQRLQDMAEKDRISANEKLRRIVKRLRNKKLSPVNRARVDEYIKDLDAFSVGLTGAKLEDLRSLDDFVRDHNEIIFPDRVKKDIERLRMKHISELTPDEVASLTEVLLSIETEVNNLNKQIDAQDKRDTFRQASQVMDDISKTKGTKAGLIRDIDDAFILETLSPERYFNRITGYVDNDPMVLAGHDLSNGEAKMQDHIMRASKIFDKWTEDAKLMRKWQGKYADQIEIAGERVGGKGKVSVKVTPAMRMSLYMHSLNDDNMRHIQYGGIVIPDMKLYKSGQYDDAYSKGTKIRLTRADIRKIANGMTAEELAFIHAAQSYYQGMSQDEINDVSVKLLGFELAAEDNYFPIHTDKDFRRNDFSGLQHDGTIEGMGSLKQRVTSTIPIVLDDITNVVNRSIKETAKYVGLAIPVRNMNNLLGVTSGSFVDIGRFKGDITVYAAEDSILHEINKKWGAPAIEYLRQVMRNLQTSGKDTPIYESLLRRVRSNYAGSVLMLNAGVALKQAASYPTAAAVLGWKPVLKAMRFDQFGKVDLDNIAKYTPVQWYRSRGFSTQEIGDIKASGINIPPFLNWIQLMDLMTTRKLWKASEFYVQDEFPDLKKGTDAYFETVAEVYNRVIWETQPNYTTMQRPGNLRSDNFLVQTLMMFKTQPFQNFNIIYDSVENLKAKETQYLAAKQYGTDAERESAEKALKRAKKDLFNSLTSQFVSMVVFAGMTAVWNTLRGKWDKYKDKEGNVNVLSVLGGLGKDVLGGAAGVIPFGSDLWEILSSWVFKGRYYGYSSVSESAIKDFLDTMASTGTAIIEGKMTPAKWKKLAKDMAQTLGIPAKNVAGLVNMILNWFGAEEVL